MCVQKKIVIERTRDLNYLKFVATDFSPKTISPSADDRLSNRPEFSGTVPIFGAMSRIPNFHLIVPNFLREPVTEIGPPKKVTECCINQ